MARGGNRSGAGRRTNWRHSPTVPIRIPEPIAEKVLQFAQALDRGEIQWNPGEEPQSLRKSSREVHLKENIRIYKLKDRDVIRLADLNRLLQSLSE